MSDNTYTVAVIGDSCTGKSTFTQAFGQYDIATFSADDCFKNEYAKPTMRKKMAPFMQKTGAHSASLSQLSQTLMLDPQQRACLQKLLAPLAESLQAQIQSCSSAYCVVEMPLYIELGYPMVFNRILLIDAPDDIQKQRFVEREGSEVVWNKRSSSRRAQHQVANEVIWNTIDACFVPKIVSRLHNHYLMLSANL